MTQTNKIDTTGTSFATKIIVLAKKVISFLVKSGLWEYVNKYYHKVVSTTALGAAILALTESPVVKENQMYKELTSYKDSLLVQDSILRKQQEFINRMDSVIIFEDNK